MRRAGAAHSFVKRCILVRSISSSAPRETRKYTYKIPTPPITSSRSPRCKSNCEDLRCTWPNPCPCFPWAATGPGQKPKPDFSPALLSSASKEKMYQMHKADPEVNTPDKLASEFRIRKQRVLAILWLKEMEKEEEARRGAPLDDTLEKLFEGLHPTFEKGRGEKHVTEAEVDDGPNKDEKLREISAKEESMLVDEFVQRMEYTKKRVSGELPDFMERPADGWSYSIEHLDDRRGMTGGFRTVVEPNGSRRMLTEAERVLVRREKNLPRKKPYYVFVKPGQLVSLKNIDLRTCLRHGTLDLYAGKVEALKAPNKVLRRPPPLPKYNVWHGVRDWPPGLLHIYPYRNKTVSRMVKAFPTLKAFRPKTPQGPPQPE